MPAKISTHVFKGMQKDINVANSSNEYLFDAHNIRLNQLDDDTLMSIVNERGNECILESGIEGQYVSHYVIGKYIVVFTYDETNEVNIIYRIDVDEPNVTVHTLFDQSDLNIRPEKPLEFTSYFEAEDVIKIYWVDGVNQLRFMNIMEELKNIADPGETPIYRAYTNPNDFNTTPELKLEETVIVEQIDGNGQFPAGVIQYALTYVNKLGAESNIFYTTKLHSIQYPTRAASPQEFINCTFQITVTNVDTSFDYIRCYQLLRTSLNAQPTCLILNEVPINGKTTIDIFDNNVGASYDPTALLFQKYPIKAYTLDQKSNTLFLGNLNEDVFEIPENKLVTIMNFFKDKIYFANSTNGDTDITYTLEGVPSYRFNPNADKIRTFKSGEVYRIAVQFQDNYGVWSQPVYIADKAVNCTQMQNGDTVYPICFQYSGDSIPTEVSGYKKFRFLMVNPSSGDRSRLTQGLVTPTMYELSDRIFNTPYAYSSWFARPFNSNIATRQNQLIPAGKDWEAEIQARLLAKDVDINLQINDWFTSTHVYDSIYTDYNDFHDTPGPATLLFDINYLLLNNTTLHIELVQCAITKNNLQLNYIPLSNVVLNGSPYSASEHTETRDGHLYMVDGENNSISSNIITALSNSDPMYQMFTVDPSQHTNLYNQLRTWINSIIIEDDGDEDDTKITGSEATSINSLNVVFSPDQYTVPSGPISVFNFNAGELSDFRVDHSILNLYSPDINNQYYEIHNNDDLILNLVGYTEVTSLLDNIYLKLENAGSSSNSTVSPYFNFSRVSSIGNIFTFARGLYKDSTVYKRFRDNVTTIMRESGMLTDYDAQHTEVWIGGVKICPDRYDQQLENSHAPLYNFIVYPWHGTGSLNNEDNTEGQVRSATYTKIFAKEWICNTTNYYDIEHPYSYRLLNQGETSATHNVSNCKLNTCFVCNNTNNVTMLKQDGISKTYIGNPDLARTFVNMKNGIIEEPQVEFGYNIYILENEIFKSLDQYFYYAHTHNKSGNLEKKTLFDFTATSNIDLRYPQAKNNETSWKPIVYKTDPIQIKYNADTHVIIPIDRTDNVLTTLPALSSNDDWDNSTEYWKGNKSIYYPIWDNWIQCTDIIPYVYDENDDRIFCNADASYFHIGELVRTVVTRYNGDIEFNNSYDQENPILISNIFIPIMEPQPISSLNGTVKTNYGDTWYGRWDCMKTQHKTDQDEQSVHDYVSIMIESHINLNGRYDSYRNFYDQTLVNAQNANKFNDVYNQMDTFWSYKVIPNYLKTTYYPNQVTWSLTKQTGALVDEWTKVTAANVQELDGNKGPINKILNYRDSLFVFQDRCISQIKYNEQTQMTTTEGVPVEISNSQKVTGVVKVYDGTGCVNKWSIAHDANGIFFVDNVNECIIWLGGSQDTPLVNLTSSKSFAQFMKANNSFTVWNPESFSNFVTFIDSAHKDIYFVNKTKCLCFSLALQEFTSFYDYQETYGMFNINNNFYSLYDKNGLKLYRNFTGKYNEIYGKFVETSFTFIDHGESFLMDKTFTNINYIQDAYDVSQNASDTIEDYDNVDYKYEPEVTFSTLRVWTPFQDTGDITLTPNEDLQRKFRTWGIQISRDLKYNNTSVDRIRNNWAKFKFTFTQPDQGNKDIKIELMNINIQSIE